MKDPKSHLELISLVLSILFLAAAAAAQPSIFTYQGKLSDTGAPPTGTYQMEFRLFDAVSGGAQIGAVSTNNAVSVTEGIFTVNLNFGASGFPGADRFLQISVRRNAGEAFVTLSPRQQVASSPYSIRTLSAAQADLATDSNQLGGIAANQYLRTNGDGSALTNLNAGSVTSGTLSNARLGQIPTANIGDNAVTAPKIAGAQVVKGITVGATTITDNVTVAGSGNITVTPTAGNTLTIASTGGGVVGSGTTNTIPLWTAGTALGDSVITQSGTGNVGIGSFSPLYKLNVQAGSTFSAAVNGQGGAFVGVRGDGSSVGVQGLTSDGVAVDGQSTNGMGVSGFSVTGIALKGSGTSWFRGDTTPTLTSSLTSSGAGVAIGSQLFSGFGYIFAYDYSASAPRNLALNQHGGNVGIGTTIPASKLDIASNGELLRFSTERPWLFRQVRTGPSTGLQLFSTSGQKAFEITASDGSNVATFFGDSTVSRVGIGTTDPLRTLHVNGRVRIGSIPIREAGSVLQVCFDAFGDLVRCDTSSLRFKNNVHTYSDGLNIVRKLRPISYNWKEGGEYDIGLGAEDVAKVAPFFSLRDKDGVVEGVRYERLNMLLINAVNQQQEMVEALGRQNELQQKQIDGQEKQIKGLIEIICADNSKAAVCRQ